MKTEALQKNKTHSTKQKQQKRSDSDCDIFAEKIFKLKLHPWQKKVLQSLSKPKTRIALKAANGSGKTAMIAAPAALWYGLIYPGSIVITTSGVYRQVKEQMGPQIRTEKQRPQPC